MKKIVSLVLALCLLLSASALAEGKLKISDMNLIRLSEEEYK